MSPYNLYLHNFLVQWRNYNAQQKHPRCKISEAKLEAPFSLFTHSTKNVISGGGQGLGCLQAAIQDQQFEHN